MMENKRSNNLIVTYLEVSKHSESAAADKKTKFKAVTALKEICLNSCPATAASSLYALTQMVERGVMSMADGLSTLISLTTAPSRVPGLVPAVGRLLILQTLGSDTVELYNISDRPHPFLTILKHNRDFWDEVLVFLLSASTENLSLRSNWRIVGPLISGIFCDPETPRHIKMQLIRFLCENKCEKSFWQLLPWLSINLDWCWIAYGYSQHIRTKQPCALKEAGCNEMANCNEAIDSFAPVLVASAVWLLQQGYEPKQWFPSDIPSYFHSTVLFLLATASSECPPHLIGSIARKGFEILSAKKTCVINETNHSIFYSAAVLASALLQWAMIQNKLTPDLGLYCEKLLKKLPELTHAPPSNIRSELNMADIKSVFCSNPNLCLAFDLAEFSSRLAVSDLEKWLMDVQLRKNHVGLMRHLFNLLSGLLLKDLKLSTMELVIAILSDWIKLKPSAASSLLAIVLHKLSAEKQPQHQLLLLKMLPNLAIDKENIPIVLGTIESLQGGDQNIMTPVRLSLMLDLWRVQPRTFSYLHRLLLGACTQARHHHDIQVSCAWTLLEICRHSAELNGRDVINLLSDLLNSSDGHKGAEVAAMAVEAITLLCKAGVVDFCSAWGAIGPKMRLENRPLVATSLCKLMTESISDETIPREPIDRLWGFVESNCSAADALRALGQFPVEAFPLNSLPPHYREGLSIPKELLQSEQDSQLPPELVLTYVPGVCWLQLLLKINPELTSAAEDLLKALIQKEVAGLPRRLYSLPLGEIEPRSYEHLPPNSLLRACTDAVRRAALNSKDPDRFYLSVLKLLGNDYLRSLPPLDWAFLRPWMSNGRTRGLTIRLLAMQGSKSPSAAILLEEFFNLINTEESLADFVKSEKKYLLERLGEVCSCVNSNTVSSVVRELLQIALCNGEQLVPTVSEMRKVVALSVIPEGNRAAVGKAIKELLSDLTTDFKEESLEEMWSCVAELPEKLVTRVIRPEEWPQVTSHRMWIAANVCRRAALLSQDSTQCPLNYFVDIIEAGCSYAEGHQVLLESLIYVLKRIESTGCRSFILQLLNRLLVAISGDTSEEGCLFLLEIVVCCTTVLSGYDVLCLDFPQRALETKLCYFPQSLRELLIGADDSWSRLVPHVVECLYRLCKWPALPSAYREHLRRGIIVLRDHEYCQHSSRWPRLFYQPLPSPSIS